jgi:hypothetical protein
MPHRGVEISPAFQYLFYVPIKIPLNPHLIKKATYPFFGKEAEEDFFDVFDCTPVSKRKPHPIVDGVFSGRGKRTERGGCIFSLPVSLVETTLF